MKVCDDNDAFDKGDPTYVRQKQWRSQHETRASLYVQSFAEETTNKRWGLQLAAKMRVE